MSSPGYPDKCTLQELINAGDGAKQVDEFWTEFI